MSTNYAECARYGCSNKHVKESAPTVPRSAMRDKRESAAEHIGDKAGIQQHRAGGGRQNEKAEGLPRDTADPAGSTSTSISIGRAPGKTGMDGVGMGAREPAGAQAQGLQTSARRRHHILSPRCSSTAKTALPSAFLMMGWQAGVMQTTPDYISHASRC